jgi:hypothetical protein
MYLGRYKSLRPRKMCLVEGRLEGDEWSVVDQAPSIRNKSANEEQECLVIGM